MSDVYSSQRLDLRRPPAMFSIIQIGGSAILFLMALIKGISLVTLFLDRREIERIIDNSEGSGTIYLMLTGILVILCLVLIIRSLSMGVKGISEFITPWRPSHVPVDFKSDLDVINGFKSRILSCYQQFVSPNSNFSNATPNLKSMKTFFGPNTMFLSPVERKVVDRNAGALKSNLWGIFWVIFLIVIGFAISSSIGEELSMTAFFLTIGLLILLAILDYVTTVGIIPRYQPNTVANEVMDYYRGFGHPSQLINRLNEAAIPLRWRDFPNRFHPSWHENASAAVGDVGNFQGSVLLEQQPQPVEDRLKKSAYLMLIIGWIFILLGNFVFLFLSGSSFDVSSSRYFGYELEILQPLISIIGLAIFSMTSASNGERMIGLARVMLESARFRSLGIYIEFAGNLARSEIKLGKSLADSIESSNVAVRSDFTARFWSAEMISEVERLDSPRELLALNQTPESASWITFFKDAIMRLREERVKPVGVELQSPEAEELIQANISIAGLRAQAQIGQTGPQTVPPPLLQPSAPESRIDSLICTSCGSNNPLTAKFCNSCGTKL